MARGSVSNVHKGDKLENESFKIIKKLTQKKKAHCIHQE